MRWCCSAWLIACMWGCQAYDLSTDRQVFQACCSTLGTCVPRELVPQELHPRLSADSCQGPQLCVPAGLAEERSHVPRSCRSVGDSEGRCLPGCLPELAAQSDQLEQTSCSPGELCAPCFDPLTGADTGACHIGADPGPLEPPSRFERCCGGRAVCIPAQTLARGSMSGRAVSAEERERLGTGTCSAPDDTCVPEGWLQSNPELPLCRALGDAEGRCVPDCLPDSQLDMLTRDSCDVGALCAPCYDPLDGRETGVCGLGNDQPREPSKVFAACCDLAGIAHGRCIPDALLERRLSASDMDRLSSDSCGEASARCVPETMLNANTPPAVCRVLGMFEGRCLSRCLPDIAARASDLDADSCGAAELCVPCFDPVTGADTGACSTGTDRPQVVAQRFADCCDTGQGPLGRCLPTELIAQQPSMPDVSLLGPDSCAQPELACVPSAWIEQPEVKLQVCRSLETFEGRCLPSCLPDVRERADNLDRDLCSEGELCVPCFDPISGAETGVCRVGADQPRTEATMLSSCCNATGSCVPTAVLKQSLAQSELAWLGQDTCEQSDARCVPQAWLESDTPPTPQSCRSLGNLEGRCLSRCLPEIAATAPRLAQDTCADEELCAPCYNPQTLEATGACSTGSDQPREPPRTFDPCCGTGDQAPGVCIPERLLSEPQRQLPVDRCRAYPARCVPRRLVLSPTRPLDPCDTTLSGRGLCFEECFLANTDRVSVSALATCNDTGRCVPCSTLPAESAEGIGCE